MLKVDYIAIVDPAGDLPAPIWGLIEERGECGHAVRLHSIQIRTLPQCFIRI
jgi:hypothetical protein